MDEASIAGMEVTAMNSMRRNTLDLGFILR